MGFNYKQMETEDDSFVVVARATCTYKRPAKFDDVLRLRARVTESHSRTITFAYEVLNDLTGHLIATGETLHVICDSKGRPKTLPGKYRKFFPVSSTPKRVTAGAQKA